MNWTLKENNQLQFYPEEYNLGALIKGWLLDFKFRIENKGITINTSINEDYLVFIDKELVKIVFRNLIDNAIKYILPKGIIDITVLKKGSYCELIIADNGPGISESILKNIQESSNLSIEGVNRSKGIGLGLLLCKKLIKKNSGSIVFKNKPNNAGSEIIIKLPIDKV